MKLDFVGAEAADDVVVVVAAAAVVVDVARSVETE